MLAGLRVARETYSISSVDRQEVLRYLGYHGQALSGELDGRIDAVVASCLKIAKPRATIAAFPVQSVSPNEVILDGCTLHLTGHDIADHLKDATQVALFAATLGMDVDFLTRDVAVVVVGVAVDVGIKFDGFAGQFV